MCCGLSIALMMLIGNHPGLTFYGGIQCESAQSGRQAKKNCAILTCVCPKSQISDKIENKMKW
jgi:hypothetical protein